MATIQTDREVDMLYEDMLAREVEKQRMEDKDWSHAKSYLERALSALFEAESKVFSAESEADGTPEQDRIGSLAEDIDRVEDAIRAEIKRIERGFAE